MALLAGMSAIVEVLLLGQNRPAMLLGPPTLPRSRLCSPKPLFTGFALAAAVVVTGTLVRYVKYRLRGAVLAALHCVRSGDAVMSTR